MNQFNNNNFNKKANIHLILYKQQALLIVLDYHLLACNRIKNESKCLKTKYSINNDQIKYKNMKQQTQAFGETFNIKLEVYVLKLCR